MKNYIFFFSLLLSQSVSSQEFVSLTEIGLLSTIAHETSGLSYIYNSSNGNFEIWTHNDFQNTDSIYSFLPTDLLNEERIIDVGLPNFDWEDMTTDDAGNLYVGNFGSSNGNTKAVIKMPDPNSYSGNPPAGSVENISFDFPTNGYQDIEGMIHLNDSLFLFVKRVSNANPDLMTGVTYVLGIPDYPEPAGANWTAKLVNEFTTQLDPAEGDALFRVTAADISPDKNVLVMLSQQRLWIFSCFEGSDFFGGEVQYVEYVNNQKEGIGFLNNHEVYISKEGKIGSGTVPKMFYLDISKWIDDSCKNCDKNFNGNFENDEFGWKLNEFNGAEGSFNVINNEAVVNITTAGSSNWHLSLRQKGFIFEQGKTYRLSFTGYTNINRSFPIIISDEFGSQHAYKSFNFTNVPTSYSHDFTITAATDYNARVNFAMGKDLGTVFIDDVSVVDLDCECPAVRDFNAPIVIGPDHFEASDLIQGSNIIGSGADHIIYDAGNQIELLSGFSTQIGVIFEAYIDGCDGN